MVLHGFSKTKQVVRLCQLSKMRTWNLFRFQCSTKSLLLDIRLYGNQFYCLTASWLISVTIVNWTFRSQPFTNIGTTPLLQKKHMQVWIQGTECLWVSMEMQPNLWQNVESKRCCVFCKHRDFQAKEYPVQPIPAMVLWRVPPLQKPDCQFHSEMGGLVVQHSLWRNLPKCSSWWSTISLQSWTWFGWYLVDPSKISISSCGGSRRLGVSQNALAVQEQLEGRGQCRDLLPLSSNGTISRCWLAILEHGWRRQHMGPRRVQYTRIHFQNGSRSQYLFLGSELVFFLASHSFHVPVHSICV